MKKQLIKATLILTLSLVGPVNSAIADQTCKTLEIVETAPASRFTVHDDGTVTDQQTGLMWAQCLQGQGFSDSDCTGSASELDWASALALKAATSDTQTRTDWRLPNIKELMTLVELACFEPAINTTVFPGLSTSSVWSSSPFVNNITLAWGVDFDFGIASTGSRSNAQSVRLVRGRSAQ